MEAAKATLTTPLPATGLRPPSTRMPTAELLTVMGARVAAAAASPVVTRRQIRVMARLQEWIPLWLTRRPTAVLLSFRLPAVPAKLLTLPITLIIPLERVATALTLPLEIRMARFTLSRSASLRTLSTLMAVA